MIDKPQLSTIDKLGEAPQIDKKYIISVTSRAVG